MDSCPRSLDNMQLERELPHCLSAKEGVWAWSTTNGLKLQPLSGQAEKWRKEGRREHVSTLKTLWNEPIPPSLQNWHQKALQVPISDLQVIRTFSLPLSPSSAWHRKLAVLTSETEISWSPHLCGKQTDETCHDSAPMPYQALDKTFTVARATRNLNLEV